VFQPFKLCPAKLRPELRDTRQGFKSKSSLFPQSLAIGRSTSIATSPLQDPSLSFCSNTPRSTRQPRYGLLSPCLACSQGTFGSPCTGIHYEEIQTVNNCVCVADRKLPSNAIIDMPSSICHTALRPLRKASHPMTEAYCCEILTNRLSTRLGKGREKE
jgi:hypothetical protein